MISYKKLLRHKTPISKNAILYFPKSLTIWIIIKNRNMADYIHSRNY